MALIVDLEVSQSVSMSGSPEENNSSSSVAPQFTITPDGTLLATRVQVPDTTASDLVTGPVFNINPPAGPFNLVGEREQGQDFSSGFRSGGMALQFTGNTEYLIDGGFQAPQGLPFTPVFDRTSVVAC